MCEFCVKHGEGKKWYLQAKNYSDDLMSDLRRRKFIADMFGKPEHVVEDIKRMASIRALPPFVQRAVKSRVLRRSKKMHFGQVLPIEDVREIFGFVNSITRLPCICRHATLGRDVGCCYAVSMGPNGGAMGELLSGVGGSFLSGPDTSRFEAIDAEEALDAMAEHEKEGCVHSVWTFVAPFTGGICNCDRSDCLAMRATVGHDIKVVFRAEYVAEINPDLCSGCRSCMRVCHFGALAYSTADRKVWVDPAACYGCGICRTACSREAVLLIPRVAQPIAARIW
jgi:NAD-dependent dihydropyrimidine dehydrogenase PreA subunit